VLRPLSLASFGVVLFPSKARLLPALVHSIDKVLAKLGVQLLCAGLVWSLLLGNVLVGVSYMFDMSVGRGMAYEKLGYREIVDRHPNWSTPVVFRGVVELVVLAQTP
jgi:hypothetical protein